MIEININENRIKELISKIDNNRKEIIIKEKEINNIKKQKIEIIDKEKEDEKVSKHVNKDSNEDFEDEVLYYYEDIDKLQDGDDLESKIIRLLPNKNNKNYSKLLLRFKMELLKNIKDLRELILIDDTFSSDDINEINKDIELNFKKISIINNLDKEKETIVTDSVENDLIFVRNDNDSVRILEDIKKMDIEYYDRVLELLKSIKDGTLKNPKTFTNNNNLNGISEVKLFQVRVLYDRIGHDKYAIITTFIKKTDNNKGYRELISLRIRNYMEQKKLLKDRMNDIEFISENKEIEQDIYNILTNKEVRVYEKKL